jgi:hypothetical protein
LTGDVARLLEPVERLVRAAGLALYDLYAVLGFELVEGAADLSFVFTQKAVPVGGRVENALGYGREDLEDLVIRLLH